jgi:hypothetical protein
LTRSLILVTVAATALSVFVAVLYGARDGLVTFAVIGVPVLARS